MAGYISERGWLVGQQQAACWRRVPCARREERVGGDTCGTVGAAAQGLAAANDTTTGLLTPGAQSGSPQDLATDHGLPLWRIRQPGPLVRQRMSQNSSPVSQAVNSPARRRRLAGMSSARPVPRLEAIAGSRLCRWRAPLWRLRRCWSNLGRGYQSGMLCRGLGILSPPCLSLQGFSFGQYQRANGYQARRGHIHSGIQFNPAYLMTCLWLRAMVLAPRRGEAGAMMRGYVAEGGGESRASLRFV